MQNLSTAERLALLELLEATAPKQAAPKLSQIPAADRSGPLPLSFAQWRLWFLDQLGIPGAVYHIPTRMRLQGELDRNALVRALDRVVARHEALRTTFAEVDGEAVQRITPAGESPFRLTEHDLRGCVEFGAELRRLVEEEAAALFDLARGPLIRGSLIRLADDDQVLLITMHHIVSDGWSMGVFTRELGALYAAFRAGEPDPLPPLPIQYGDFAVWQRRWVDGEVLKAQADYWKESLAGAPELLELPTDRARPPRQSFTGRLVRVELDAELSAGVKALAQRHGATLYMTILAAWTVVLSRLSGQAHVVVGTPTAGRARREIEGLIGFFVNTLVLRLDVSGGPSVAQLLARVKERALEVQQNQDIPFEQVVELVQPVRTLAHTPLFQVMFNWLNTPSGDFELSGLALSPMQRVAPRPAPLPESAAQPEPAPAANSAAQADGTDGTEGAAAFDLTLTLSERNGRIGGSLEYATALFDAETIARHLAYLRRVLAQMVADERRSVARLELMSPEERAQVVEEWNATELPSPEGLCVHELFERRAEETPAATAVVFEGGELTYAELNARANRLAHRLRALGVVPDARVAICAERTPEMVAGLLAVLKAGGAYVPLDPAYPEERLRWLLEDSAPVAVLAHGSLAARFAGAGVPVLELDAGSPAWAEGPETNPGRGALLPDHLAYVIHTSGSTGRPKGVMVTHRAVGRQAAAVRSGFGLRADDRVLQFASIAFDAAVEEIFGALLTGAALVLRSEAWLEGAHAFWGRCAENRVSVADLPTRFWQLLLDEPGAAVPECVRLLAIGGEAVEPAALRAWFGRDGYRPPLLNTYGPTETTVNATLGEVAGDPATWRSIGRPVANTRAYLLDAAGEPVPVKVAGELYLGGGQVARGYQDRPGLTAERFVPDPFAREPGARLYRTGDVGRWRPDGSIEFLGRTDFQVKIRGFRIELGEIEARLAEHAAVGDAVVLAREDVPGERRLVAYCVADEGLDVESLRAHLAQRLPSYMVPVAFVRLDAFPATAGGKVDRRALPAPEGDALAADAYEAPVGETEEVLAEIWAEVLGVERVGRHDSFFEIGGHSLLAVRVVSRMRQVLEAPVALAHLFSHPTIESFAARLAGADEQHRSDRAIAIRPTGSRPPVFLAYDGMGSTLYAQVLQRHIDAEIPVYALPSPSPSEPPLRTVEAMAARLVRMILEVQPSGPYRLAGWSFGGVLSYEAAAQLIGRDETVEFVGMFDTPRPGGSAAAARAHAESQDPRLDHALVLHALRTADTTADGGGAESDEEIAAAGDGDLETFVRKCREDGLLPRHVTVAQARAVRDRLRSHQRAVREYSPPPLPVLLHQFPAGEGGLTDPTLGWGSFHPRGRLRVTPVPGTHLSMMRAPNAATLGEALSRSVGTREEAPPRSAAGHSPLVTLQGGAAGAAPLFCLPGAGSGVTDFVDLMSALGPSVPIYGLQPRGIDGEAPPHATVQAAAEHYLRALRQACPAGPVHLLGHSFGGWVALEMALRLHEAGRPVASLTILDSEVPDDSEAVVHEYGGGEAFLKLVEVLELATERSLGIGPAEVDARDEAGWLRLLHGKMVGLGLLGARATPEVLAGPFRTFARCLRTSYRPAGVYPGRVRLVLVDDPAKDEAANRAHFAEVQRGWREWAPGLVFSVGAGNHITALKLPHVAALAGLLAEDRG
jgi:amino acid adenylation domain-containing protein